MGQPVSRFRCPAEAHDAQREFERAWQQGSHQYEALHQRADGGVVSVEIAAQRVEVAGEPRVLQIVRDVTWLREAGQRIRYLNRMLRMLLAIGEAMIRARDADSFLGEACALAAWHGGFSAAWIATRGADGWRIRAAEAGDSALVQTIRESGSATNLARHLDRLAATGHAERRLTQDRDTPDPWRQILEQHGVAAFASAPIRVGGRADAAFVLYASKPAQLDAEFLPLLEQLAGDIGFALEGIHARAREREATAELRKLSRALEQSTSGVVITDTSGRIEYVNSRFSEITGYTAEDAVGRNPRILRSGENPVSLYAEMWGTLLAGHEWSGELRNRRKDGQAYWARLSISGIRDETGAVTHYVGLQDDVSERRKIDAELATLQRQFAMAQKMEAVGRLAGGVAHDFNNVLGVIIGYSEMLLRAAPDESARRKLTQIVEAADRAAGLTRQLLAFSRRQALEPRVLDLNVHLRGLEKLLRQVIGEDIDLRLTLSADLGRVRADPTQIDQIVINLAGNARDAMPTGGSLLIETRNTDLDETLTPAHEPMRPGPYVRLSITDQGSGMAPEVLTHIFEPFFTTKPEGQGTGLGLATVYGIVKQSEGYIWPYSEPGQGTSFHIYLPRVPDAAESLPREAATAARGRGERVLVVEDQAPLRELTTEMLTALGYTVHAAASGEHAEALVSELDEPLDLLLTDVVMPGRSGPELAARLCATRPQLKVLFMSGYTDEMLVSHGAGDERLRLLQKPFTLDQLARRVRQALTLTPTG